ncbi:tRNA uridine(34) hydroxylase, N-terminal [Dillenia turbinata]|uniref:tRNA uridine(34) hydroxylase, N-terminal n=1 Tax=Dillenia turbinata TaxID=194707 RepID=A0AAN8YQQ2_9MAGN
MADNVELQEEYGVLLYYKYAEVRDLEELFSFYNSNCNSLRLLGRVRLAPHGVNVTVGGKLKCLGKHIDALKENAIFEGTDFKLASCAPPMNDRVANECGFTSLSIRIVKELVTLSSCPLLKPPKISEAGRHLSAVEFHSVLQNSGQFVENKHSDNHKKLVLLDARNAYETRIGKFQSPNVETMDPQIRQYSDLPLWIDDNSEQLRGNHILMYLKNRCYRCSFFILMVVDLNLKDRVIWAAALEECFEVNCLWTNGTEIGLRAGKDHDLALGLTLEAAKSFGCSVPSGSLSWIFGNQICYQRYCTGGIRCEMASAYIRSKGPGFENVFQLYGGIQRYLEQFPGGGFFKGKNFVFDHRIAVASSNSDIIGACLLCGSSFDDYSSRCRCTYCRMLVLICDKCQKEHAQYVCELCQKHKEAEAVHIKESSKGCEILASNTQTESHQPEDTVPSNHATQLPEFPSRHGPLRKLRILCLHGFRQNASGFKGRTASLAKKLKNIAELVFVNAPHELPFIYQACLSEQQPVANQSHQPPEKCNKKFAWLVPPDFNEKAEDGWRITDGAFDPLQYQQQIDGFDESLVHLENEFSRKGPFDGILGFSQGAAMAASVCALRRRREGQVNFRFVILCSGFALKSMKVEQGSINCPSLHIFGRVEGKDRQIMTQASRDLAALFEEGCSVTIEHEYGHIIPARSPYVDKIKDFLQRGVGIVVPSCGACLMHGLGSGTFENRGKDISSPELTPGLNTDEYISRGKRLLELLPEKNLAIIAAAPLKMMNDLVSCTFIQDADISQPQRLPANITDSKLSTKA